MKRGKCTKKRHVQGLTCSAAAGDPGQEPGESVVRPVVHEAAENVQVCGREAVTAKVTWVTCRRGGDVEVTRAASAASVRHTDVTQTHTDAQPHTHTDAQTHTGTQIHTLTQKHACGHIPAHATPWWLRQ